MQSSRSERLRETWWLQGNKPCEHPRIEREYYIFSLSGLHCCTTCGLSQTKAEWQQWLKSVGRPEIKF
jgi:hypothetical protein